jgi:hypothetical protein
MGFLMEVKVSTAFMIFGSIFYNNFVLEKFGIYGLIFFGELLFGKLDESLYTTFN